MGQKKYFDFRRRAGKTQKAIDAIKSYIGGISKKDRESILRELEKEGDSEEESPRYETVVFRGSPATFTTVASGEPNTVYYQFVNNSGYVTWETTEQHKQEIEEEVQDVTEE